MVDKAGARPGTSNGAKTTTATKTATTPKKELKSEAQSSDTKKTSTDSISEKPTVPNTDSLSTPAFIDAILMRLLYAQVVDDSKTDRKNSESLEDGPPSRADVTITVKEVLRLTTLAITVFIKESVLLRIDASVLPLLIVGDIHGQFIHLRSLFEMFGGPMETSTLFLGDYIDRGVQGIECMCLLLAMKIKYGKKVFMLRGNHEDANTTLSYGFQEECMCKFGKVEGMNVWKSFVDVFNVLPLAAVVNKKIFCVHGGLSPFMDSIEEIEKIQRPLLIPAFGLATDLVWADPDQKNPGWSLSHRGVSFFFDGKIVEEFCRKNAIDLIVRGHQISSDMHNDGYKFFAGGRLVTIFSAPNYLNYHNAAAVLLVSRNMTVRMTVFRSVEEEDKEQEKLEQFRKEREERRKQRLLKKLPVTPPAEKKPVKPEAPVSDPDTSCGTVSEGDDAKELSARDVAQPDSDKKTETEEEKSIQKK